MENNDNAAPLVPSLADRQLADYAMAFDLVSKMANAPSEESVIEKTFELFSSLCAPDRVVYLQFVNGTPKDIFLHPASPADEETIKDRLIQSLGNAAWTLSESGFILRIHHEDNTLGILSIEEIPFTQYRKHYLNLGLNLVDVIALAISNARSNQARKLTEQEREITVEFLHLVSSSVGSEDLIKGAVSFFQERSGCEALGIRLKKGDDFPYYEVRGFPKEFVTAENSLCAKDAAGDIIRDSIGNPVLACMCGNIICGRFDPVKEFFSKGGSFWTNSATDLLASTTESERQARTRNRCHGEGYESVALIPLRVGEERLGLIQMNDRRQGMFTPEIIALWERLAGYLSMAMIKFRAEEDVIKLNDAVAARNLELEDLNKELEAFIYSVSHDLRAPLRTISGFIKILAEDYSERLDVQGRDYLDRIFKGSEKMSQLIKDLLYLSQISRQEIGRSMFSMSNKAASIISDLREANPGRIVEVSMEQGIKVFADPGLTEIVLANLLGNAWKFTSKTEKARISFGATDQDGKTVYYVRDNGTGFDPDFKEKLFLPFRRLHSDKDFEGTGIGLSIVERVIRSHGGQIWVESEKGKGVTFFFTLN